MTPPAHDGGNHEVTVDEVKDRLKTVKKRARSCKHCVSGSIFYRRRYDIVAWTWIICVPFLFTIFGLCVDVFTYGEVSGPPSVGFFLAGLFSAFLSILHLVFQMAFKGRLRTMWELIFHIMFYAVLCAYVETRASSNPMGNHVNRWMTEQFGIENENYENIRDFHSLWTYIQNDFIEAYNTTSTAPLFGVNALAFNHGSVLVADSIRIRQVRVRKDTCDSAMKTRIRGLFSTLDCYGTWSYSNEETGDWSDNGGTTWEYKKTVPKTVSRKDYESSAYIVGPDFSPYHDHGYSIELPLTQYSSWNSTLDTLRTNGWIGPSTRAVFFEHTWYFPYPAIWLGYTHMFTVNQDTTVTPLPSPFARIGNMGVDTYDTGLMLFDLQELMWILNSFAAAMLLVEILDIIQIESLQDLSQYWTLFKVIDWINILGMILAYCLMAVSAGFILDSSRYYNTSISGYDHQPWGMVTQNWIDSRRVLAFSTFVSIIRFLKFFSFIPKIGVMEKTLTSAKWELLAFTTVFIVVVLAFAQALHVIFSVKIADFSSYYTALISSFGALLGTLDVHVLTSVDPIFGPALFISFIFLNLFILLNIFITITNNSYERTVADARNRARSCTIASKMEKGDKKMKLYYQFGFFDFFKEHDVHGRGGRKAQAAMGTVMAANKFVRTLQRESMQQKETQEIPSNLSEEEILTKEIQRAREELEIETSQKQKLQMFVQDMQAIAKSMTRDIL